MFALLPVAATATTAAADCSAPDSLAPRRPKAAGMVFSPFGTGIVYEHYAKGKDFHSFSVETLYWQNLFNTDTHVGGIVRYSYDVNLYERAYEYGVLNVYCGPMASTGYVYDIKRGMGYMVSIGADVRLEYTFKQVPAIISVAWHPAVGGFVRDNGHPELSFYRSSICEYVFPQIGVKYALDKPDTRPDVDGRYARFSYGLEWGYSCVFWRHYNVNFITEDGYRAFRKDGTAWYNSNGFLYVHFGVNLGKHFNLALYTGYEGRDRQYRVIPITFRGTYFYGRDRLRKGRWFNFLDGGIGVEPTTASVSPAAKLGGGYRISLNSNTKLDFMLSMRTACVHPPVYELDGQSVIPDSRIGRNDIWNLSLNASMAICF